MKRREYARPQVDIVPMQDDAIMKNGSTETEDIMAKEAALEGQGMEAEEESTVWSDPEWGTGI